MLTSVTLSLLEMNGTFTSQTLSDAQNKTSLEIWQEIAQSRGTPMYLILITLLQRSFKSHVLESNVITEQACVIYEYVQDVLSHYMHISLSG